MSLNFDPASPTAQQLSAQGGNQPTAELSDLDTTITEVAREVFDNSPPRSPPPTLRTRACPQQPPKKAAKPRRQQNGLTPVALSAQAQRALFGPGEATL